jgi:DNA-binding IscR family transcriptional regulator
MYEVIEAIDGPIQLNVCLVSGRSCNRKTCCPAHPVWVQAQRAMLDVLIRTGIGELASQSSAGRFEEHPAISILHEPPPSC